MAGAEDKLASFGLPAVLLRHSAENTVEIVNSAGGRLEISLTTSLASNRAMGGQIMEFAKAACLDVADEAKDQSTHYLARVLTEFLRGGHGALLAAAPCNRPLHRTKLADGVILTPPIPLILTMLAAMKEQTAAAASLLRSQEALLRGMIASDGVTILGTDGSIRAFRVFVQPGRKQASGRQQASSGGARSRAFSVLRDYVGNALRAALFRSQDGRTEVVVPS